MMWRSTLDFSPITSQTLQKGLTVLLEVGSVLLLNVLDKEAIALEEVFVAVTERITRLTDTNGLEHTGVTELLKRHETVEEIRLLLRVRLNASDVVRFSGVESGHEVVELFPELATKSHLGGSLITIRRREEHVHQFLLAALTEDKQIFLKRILILLEHASGVINDVACIVPDDEVGAACLHLLVAGVLLAAMCLVHLYKESSIA